MYENTETKHLATAINEVINSISQQTTLVQQSYFQENKLSVPKQWSVATNGLQWVAEQYHLCTALNQKHDGKHAYFKSLRITEINHQSQIQNNCCNSRCRFFSLTLEIAENIKKYRYLVIHVKKFFHVITSFFFFLCF